MTSERNQAQVDRKGGSGRESGPDIGPGPLLDPETGDRLEQEDRKRPIPGGEPSCPRCGSGMIRHVEKHPAPRGGHSPFRIRLACASEECGAWTVYDW